MDKQTVKLCAAPDAPVWKMFVTQGKVAVHNINIKMNRQLTNRGDWKGQGNNDTLTF